LLPLAQAAAACYANDAVFAWQNELKLAHVLHTTVNGVNTFAMAGTMDVQEWLVDLLAMPVPVAAHPQLGDVHAGFLIDVEGAVRDCIVPTMEKLGWPPFYLTGHSKGAGEAILAHGLLKALGHAPLATRAFEPPSVGGGDLVAFLAGEDLVWTQTFNASGDDIVTLVPKGPTWWRPPSLVRLPVPDTDDWVTKHKIPAVLAAIGA
jgi:hypothetical protein